MRTPKLKELPSRTSILHPLLPISWSLQGSENPGSALPPLLWNLQNPHYTWSSPNALENLRNEFAMLIEKEGVSYRPRRSTQTRKKFLNPKISPLRSRQGSCYGADSNASLDICAPATPLPHSLLGSILRDESPALEDSDPAEWKEATAEIS